MLNIVHRTTHVQILLRVALLSVAVVVGSGCAPAARAEAPAATPVALARAVAVGSSPRYRGPGTVAAQHVYRVGFEIAGRVTSVQADVGDHVGAGATLAVLATADYAAQARVAVARAESAAAVAARADNGARIQERRNADDAVEAARAQLARALAAERLASSNATRFDTLYRDGDVSAQQHDQTTAAAGDARAAVDAARAQLAQAQAQRSLTEAGARAEDRRSAGADAAAARANAELAGLTLAKTQLVAPADAYVLERDVEPGNIAAPGAVAFVLTDARDPDVLVAVPEASAGGIAPGTTAVVHLGGRTWHGSVARLEPAADPASRTTTVRVRVPGLRAIPGAVADVELGTRRDAGTARIPLGALVNANGAAYVAVYDRAHATTVRRPVRVAELEGDSATVAGIAPGTEVVRIGAHLVVPGARVTVTQ